MSNHTVKQQIEILLNMSVYIAEMQLSEDGRSATYTLINSIAEEFDIELEDDMTELMEDAGVVPFRPEQEKTKPSLSVVQSSKKEQRNPES